MSKRKLLLVGWDAADWRLINPLMDRGEMPNLQKLVEGGSSGPLRTLEPALSPMLWTSIATGKNADEHRILGFLEPDPFSSGARTVTSTSRHGKAVWNILHQQGLRPSVVNWFASHPAEPIRGVCVSDSYAAHTASVPTGTIHPAEFERELLELRLSVTDLRGEDLRMFVPQLGRVDQDKDPRLFQLGRVLAENLTVHAAATWILEKQPWDFMAFYFDVIDHAGHFFMKYHPPRMEGVSEEDCEIYGGVMNHVYRFCDLLLGRTLALAGPDATVMLISDHGFRHGADRPKGPGPIPMETALNWHAPYGVFCLTGPGIKRDEIVHGAGLLDIAPTILALFDLPAGDDMAGRVLAEAFEEAPAVVAQRIPSWDSAPGDAGLHPPEFEGEAADSAAAMEQLAALGYVDPAPAGAAQRRELATVHQTLNLARVYLSQGRSAEAVAELEKLDEKYGSRPGLQLMMARAMLAAKQPTKCRELVTRALGGNPENRALRLTLANVCLAEGEHQQALEHLFAAETADRPPNEEWHLLVGRAYLRMSRPGDAETNYRAALALNPQSAAACRGVAAALLARQEPKKAAEAALAATGLEYSHASGHYLLGVALARAGYAGRAVEAFEVCLRLRPEALRAHLWLAEIHRALGDTGRAQQHAAQWKPPASRQSANA